jgi:hypothetical protein
MSQCMFIVYTPPPQDPLDVSSEQKIRFSYAQLCLLGLMNKKEGSKNATTNQPDMPDRYK